MNVSLPAMHLACSYVLMALILACLLAGYFFLYRGRNGK
jgi:hypothetical protein